MASPAIAKPPTPGSFHPCERWFRGASEYHKNSLFFLSGFRLLQSSPLQGLSTALEQAHES